MTHSVVEALRWESEHFLPNLLRVQLLYNYQSLVAAMPIPTEPM